jgi:hypothetical protein
VALCISQVPVLLFILAVAVLTMALQQVEQVLSMSPLAA